MSEPMSVPEAIRERLKSRLGPVQFSDINAHLDRDAVFIVGAELDLVECGVAVATDDVDRVRAWIDAGQLRKPSAGERREWPTQGERRWMAVVVQPFVLVQDAIVA